MRIAFMALCFGLASCGPSSEPVVPAPMPSPTSGSNFNAAPAPKPIQSEFNFEVQNAAIVRSKDGRGDILIFNLRVSGTPIDIESITSPAFEEVDFYEWRLGEGRERILLKRENIEIRNDGSMLAEEDGIHIRLRERTGPLEFGDMVPFTFTLNYKNERKTEMFEAQVFSFTE